MVHERIVFPVSCDDCPMYLGEFEFRDEAEAALKTHYEEGAHLTPGIFQL